MRKLISIAGLIFLGAACLNAQADQTWSREGARNYLDSRMSWWITWPPAARDHETFCISCHTALPYALGRSALRSDLHETTLSHPESQLVDNIVKRERMWNLVEPFYSDAHSGPSKTVESRGTESVLDALILVTYLPNSSDARLALDHMWTEQLRDGPSAGAFNWLQFHNAPWEGDSQYYGATLAALAAGIENEHTVGVTLLRDYLLREQSSQVLLNRVMLLWASTKLKGLLTPAQQNAIIAEALIKQQPDGGFSLSGFVGDWKRHDSTPLDTRSDGLATGLVTLALQDAGVSRDQANLQRALLWLARDQDPKEGRWVAYSLNKNRDLSSDVGRFMSDAATAFAVLSLER